jgi:hypothetical protein
MISSSKVQRKGGLIIYQLNDVDDLTEESHDNHDYNEQATNNITQEIQINRLDDIFDEMADETPVTMSKKRITVVLDGANIGKLHEYV